MNIVILYGQPVENAGKDEQDTLVQVETVSRALVGLGHEPIPIPLSLNLSEASHRLQTCCPDIVFNLVESLEGQGQLIHLSPTLLDSLKLSYTGAGTEAIFVTSNKLLAKKFLRRAGIPTPDWFSLEDLSNGVPFQKGRYIVKSVWEHASVGLAEDSVIHAEQVSDLRDALEHRQTILGGEGFTESYIQGREFNLALLAGDRGPEILPPAEIRFDAYPKGKLRIVDYRAKWLEESFEYQNTPRRFNFPYKDELLLQRLKTLAMTCWKLFGLRGYARVDFRVDREKNPWILEVNTNPCLSPDAGFMAAAKRAGLSFEQVVERILRDSC
jgi:D-alanine-D-alanine ligase